MTTFTAPRVLPTTPCTYVLTAGSYYYYGSTGNAKYRVGNHRTKTLNGKQDVKAIRELTRTNPSLHWEFKVIETFETLEEARNAERNLILPNLHRGGCLNSTANNPANAKAKPRNKRANSSRYLVATSKKTGKRRLFASTNACAVGLNSHVSNICGHLGGRLQSYAKHTVKEFNNPFAALADTIGSVIVAATSELLTTTQL